MAELDSTIIDLSNQNEIIELDLITGDVIINEINEINDDIISATKLWSSQKINTEIESEAAMRENADNDLQNSINGLASIAHVHNNKNLLDTYNQTNDDIADAINKKHTHDNKAILDATQESFTTALKNSYDSHLVNTNNPHNTTAAQVGLGNVTNDAQLKRAAGDFNSFTEKTIPADADITLIEDGASGYTKKKLSWSNIKVTLKTYFDTLYAKLVGLTAGYIPYKSASGELANSPIYTNGTNVSIGTTSTSAQLTQQSTTALESAPLGPELLSSSGWTTTGWTGDWVNGFTHTTGNTNALTNTLSAVNGNLYQITYTVTGRTAGSFTITFGGVTSPSISSTGAWGPKAISTGSLSITPTTDFNGTIIISIKQITGIYNPTYVILNSAGGNALEIRSTSNALSNIFIGNGVGRYNTTGYSNTAQGVSALSSNTTGYYNTAQGVSALSSNTTGYQNSAQGVNALSSNTTGYQNSAQGVNALSSNTTGYQNSAQGVNALFSNSTGYYNTAQGVNALFSNSTGYYNTAQGVNALSSNTTGYQNSAQGVSALSSNTTGYSNTAQGVSAGRFISGGSSPNQTSNNSVYLGYNTMALADGDTNEIVIGANAVGAGSNSVVLGNDSITKTILKGSVVIGATTPTTGYKLDVIGDIRCQALTQYSDANKKENINNLDLGLDFVTKLRPVSYKWKDVEEIKEYEEVEEDVYEEQEVTTTEKVIEIIDGKYVSKEIEKVVKQKVQIFDEYDLYDEQGNVIGKHQVPRRQKVMREVVKRQAENHKRTHFGLVAQEIEKIIKDMGIDLRDFGMLKITNYDNPEAEHEYGLDYTQLIPVLIKAIQELKAKVEQLEQR